MRSNMIWMKMIAGLYLIMSKTKKYWNHIHYVRSSIGGDTPIPSQEYGHVYH